MLTLDNLAAAIVAGLPPQYRGAVVLADKALGGSAVHVRLMLDGKELHGEYFSEHMALDDVRRKATRSVLAAILRTGDPVDDAPALTLDNLAAAIVAALPPLPPGAAVLVDTGGARQIRVRLVVEAGTLHAQHYPQDRPLESIRDHAAGALLSSCQWYGLAMVPAPAPSLTRAELQHMLAVAGLVYVTHGAGRCGAREGFDVADRVDHLHRLLTGAT